MAKLIENQKTYAGRELESIFFRPILSGPDALKLGIKVMYNMPVPTTLSFWSRNADVLKKYGKGWLGGNAASKYQKRIDLQRVKAELGFAAGDYYNMVFEQIASNSQNNLDDLSGSELEIAETTLFKEAIAEAIRVTMWIGDTTRSDCFNTFNGFIKRIKTDIGALSTDVSSVTMLDMTVADNADTLFRNMWNKSSEVLKQFKNDGDLVYLVTSDIYNNYEDTLDNISVDNAYLAKLNGHKELFFKGIPVVDVKLSQYLPTIATMPKSFAILTERNNLALAVNTNDFPGMEVKMWYNPDEMENRQRAVFMAGCDYLLPELVVASFQ